MGEKRGELSFACLIELNNAVTSGRLVTEGGVLSDGLEEVVIAVLAVSLFRVGEFVELCRWQDSGNSHDIDLVQVVGLVSNSCSGRCNVVISDLISAVGDTVFDLDVLLELLVHTLPVSVVYDLGVSCNSHCEGHGHTLDD